MTTHPKPHADMTTLTDEQIDAYAERYFNRFAAQNVEEFRAFARCIEAAVSAAPGEPFAWGCETLHGCDLFLCNSDAEAACTGGQTPFPLYLDSATSNESGVGASCGSADMQARIDELMLEYCPSEMAPQQMANWAAHQNAAPPNVTGMAPGPFGGMVPTLAAQIPWPIQSNSGTPPIADDWARLSQDEGKAEREIERLNAAISRAFLTQSEKSMDTLKTLLANSNLEEALKHIVAVTRADALREAATVIMEYQGRNTPAGYASAVLDAIDFPGESPSQAA